MKPTFVLATVGVAVGTVLGVFIGPSLRNIQQQQQLSSLSKQTDVMFDRCDGLSAEASKGCADALLVEEALRKQDRTLCSSVVDTSIQKDCAARVDRLAKLGNLATWCMGVSTDSLCIDLATVLAASEARDISKCSGIGQKTLLQACNNLIIGSPVTDSTGGETAIPVSRTFQFGYNCDESNTYCVQDKTTFLAAVNTNNAKLCDDFTFNKELCLQEVATYSAFKSGSSTSCTAAPNKALCQYDIVLAKALESSDPNACKSLETKQVAGCQEQVRITKEKRFDYLK